MYPLTIKFHVRSNFSPSTVYPTSWEFRRYDRDLEFNDKMCQYSEKLIF